MPASGRLFEPMDRDANEPTPFAGPLTQPETRQSFNVVRIGSKKSRPPPGPTFRYRPLN